MAVFRGGELVFMLERRQIQGQPPESIAAAVAGALSGAGPGASTARPAG
jgi:hypothetical protein